MIDSIKRSAKRPSGHREPYELVHFSRHQEIRTCWNVVVYKTNGHEAMEVMETLTIDCHTPFFADQLWCDTGPGQDFLWDDYPSDFQNVLRKYSANHYAKSA